MRAARASAAGWARSGWARSGWAGRLDAVRIDRGSTTGKPGLVTQGRRGPARERRFPAQSLTAGRVCPLQVLARRPLRLQEGLRGRGERRLVEQAQREVADLDAEERRLQTGAAGEPDRRCRGAGRMDHDARLGDGQRSGAGTALQVAVAGQLLGVGLSSLPDLREPVGGRHAVQVDHGSADLDDDRGLRGAGVVHGDRRLLAPGQPHHRVDGVRSHQPSFVTGSPPAGPGAPPLTCRCQSGRPGLAAARARQAVSRHTDRGWVSAEPESVTVICGPAAVLRAWCWRALLPRAALLCRGSDAGHTGRSADGPGRDRRRGSGRARGPARRRAAGRGDRQLHTGDLGRLGGDGLCPARVGSGAAAGRVRPARAGQRHGDRPGRGRDAHAACRPR